MSNNDDYRLLLNKHYENILIELYKNNHYINDNIIGVKFVYDNNQNIIDIIYLYNENEIKEMKSNMFRTNSYVYKKIYYDEAIKKGFILFATKNDKNKIAYIHDTNDLLFKFSPSIRIEGLINIIKKNYKQYIINKFINNT